MLTLLYHRVAEGKNANPLPRMEEHLQWIRQHANTLLPGEPLCKTKLNLCLTFDDAYYDFYHYVFPLLKKYGLRAVLAVPVRFIQEKTDLSPAIRLSVTYKEAMKGDLYESHVPFCTWAEVCEMAASGCVEIASHSVHHQSLLTPGLDLELEIAGSKRIIEEKIGRPVKTFVYPLGKFDRRIHRQVKRYYAFAMRIGTAWNLSWQNWHGMIYRVMSDNLTASDEPFRLKRKMTYAWFYLINTLRGR